LFVMCRLVDVEVMGAIYFDAQTDCGCVKIHNVVADGLLPVKPDS
jgi:hypothetical protein